MDSPVWRPIIFSVRTLCSVLIGLFTIASASATPIRNHSVKGAEHGYLLLKNESGKLVGVGDILQIVRGNVVHARITYHFHDGSIDDETTVFTQGSSLHLISDHHVQKGPSFPKPLDLSFVTASGQVTWHEFKDGKDEVKTDHMDLPDDLANGIVPFALEDLRSNVPDMKVSFLTGAGKPRLVTLKLTHAPEDSFTIGGAPHSINVFNIHIEIGGVAGVVAPVIGKQPGDIRVWITQGEAQTAVKMVGALYDGGPVYTSEQAAPVWGR